ncbi:uncharacterized protein BKA78DRAFT_357825 [Phyllosticta capitalensis]|uniref:uncharacterized protein n=1 Tax=Phyllosticta capitalensis TaxID=121624 RepID=UPI00312D518C
MASATTPLILCIPNELVLLIGEEVARDPVNGFGELVAFSSSCKPIRVIIEHLIFKTIELLTKANTRDGAVHYARMAQHRPRISSRRLQTVFLASPPAFLKYTKSLAFHAFWDTSSVNVSTTPSWMATGLGRLLLKPTCLRRLEIDGHDQFAQGVKSFFAGMNTSCFGTLDELVISMEFRFLLTVAPNLTKLSNRPREGFGRSLRTYDQATAQEFLDLCSALPKLHHLDLSIADFEHPDGSMSIQSLQVSRERQRCPRPVFQYAEGRIPMAFILNLIRPQQGLHTVKIPAERDISMGNMDPAAQWTNVGGYATALVAAIVVVKCPRNKAIHVGDWDDNYTVERISEKQMTVLKPPGDHDPSFNEHFEVICVHQGAEGSPAWFEDGDKYEDAEVYEPYDELNRLVVNEQSEVFHRSTALVAAIVVVQCPGVKDIEVRDWDRYAVERDSEKDRTLLKPPGDDDPTDNEHLKVVSVSPGAEGSPAWFEDGERDEDAEFYDEEKERNHLVVNEDCDAFGQYNLWD